MARAAVLVLGLVAVPQDVRRDHLLQLTATLDDVLTPSKEGQGWILLWDMASSLTSCCASSRGTARRTCSPETWPSSASSRAASKRRRAPLLPAPSSTARSTKKQVWSTGWRQFQARSDDDVREAAERANELHASGDLYAKQIEPEPAEWTMAEASRPCLTRQHRRNAATSSIRTSDVQLGAVHRAPPGVRRWTALSLPKSCHLRHFSASLSLLSHVSVVPCVLPTLVSPHQPQAPRQ